MICSRKSRGGVYEGYPNHVESLKRVVFKETAEPCRWRSETRNLNSGLKQLMKINCVATWRLGAQDILELPLLTASFKMEPAPMAGKTWQTSHEPPRSSGGPPGRDGTERGAHGAPSQSPQLPTSDGTQRS